MKANLPRPRGAERLAVWETAGLYEQIRRARAGAPQYILHDGPPYANGAIHLGHALNKCLKDFVVKTKTMSGFDSPYVPGWICYGLPIEIKVDEQLGGRKLELNPIQVRQACREYAQKYIDLQRSQFKRLGVLGRWNDPYSTMNFPYEARIVETFYGFFEKGFVYKGLKPVYRCWPRSHPLRSPKPRSSTNSTPRPPSTCATTHLAPRANRPEARRPRGLHHRLDDHTMDASRINGRRVQSGD